MSSVDSIYGLYQSLDTSSTTSTTSSETVDSFSFLELFLVQLQNQDPTSPMDTTEMTDQLCSYSQLEQLQTISESISQQNEYQQASFNSQAVQLIGNSIVVEGDNLTKDGDDVSSIVLDLEDDVSEAIISIYDDQGEQVAQYTVSGLSEGRNVIEWDGTNGDGESLADGDYTYEVTASGDDSDVEIDSYSSSKVLSVVFRDGEAVLQTASGLEVLFSNVTQVL